MQYTVLIFFFKQEKFGFYPWYIILELIRNLQRLEIVVANECDLKPVLYT